MELIEIKQQLSENPEFVNEPLCGETLQMTIDFYRLIGYVPPWICYYAKEGDQLVGSAGFKGKPANQKIEIAYGTFEKYRKMGMGAKICAALVQLALKTDPTLKITARTLPEKNFSTRILEKNNFVFVTSVNDPEDGEVWEWEYQGNK